ncbi:hypothetical protein [Flavobacterium daejeonense]|uniref:hypothetical protein n=1 Tax=Flavobacterium daejeonense TaxID=350893 RepID=UPI00047E5EF7|nr:hypothetical protein [Flavobacterium daejeonense]
MKNIVFLFLLIAFNVFSKPLEFNTTTDTLPSIAEVYYNRLEVSTRLPHFTNEFIDRKANERPEVPATVWQAIKDSLDYAGFKNLAIQVLNNNFTATQMQQTMTEYQYNPYIPILHLKLRNELQLALQEFNPILMNQINAVLVANGFQSI